MNHCDPENNVWLNEKAVAVIEEASQKLKAMGLHVIFFPNAAVPESLTAVTLHVAPTDSALIDCMTLDRLACYYVTTYIGGKNFDSTRIDVLADCSPSAEKELNEALNFALKNPPKGINTNDLCEVLLQEKKET